MRRMIGRLAVALLCSGVTCSVAAADATTRARAVSAVAQSDSECRKLGDFYWEIGDASGVLGSGAIGTDYAANTSIKLASASKLVWGSYVLEKIGPGQQPSAEQIALLQMRSGYTRFNPLACLFSKTVDACASARSNAERVSGDVGYFSYSGGHDQRLAQLLGLGRLDAAQMTQELRRQIGQDLEISYSNPQPAGGMEATPAAYGKFLRKIVSGQLRMRSFLGFQPVCTQCAQARSSPADRAWHYSLNHWIEDDAQGDGAFSSPGLMGFYPWISADKTTYGLLARQKLAKKAYVESAACGRKLRAAWTKSG